MANTKPFHVEGLKDLEKMLEQLSKSMAKTVLRNALKKAGKPMAEAAKSMVPVGPTGNLRRSIAVSVKLNKNQRPGGFRDRTAVNVYVGNDYKIGPHAHLVEFGTSGGVMVAGKKGKRATGKKALASSGEVYGTVAEHPGLPARPFMRPAFDATKNKMLDIFIKEVANELLKSVARLRKRAATGKLGAAQLRALRR